MPSRLRTVKEGAMMGRIDWRNAGLGALALAVLLFLVALFVVVALR